MKEEPNLLEGLPPTKKIKLKRRKKFVPTRGIPVEVSVRRQVAEEIGEAEPTRDQKYILLQKYGAVVAVVDRRVSKPNWMGVVEWKRKLNEWFKATKGLTNPVQRKRNNEKNSRFNQSSNWKNPRTSPHRFKQSRPKSMGVPMRMRENNSSNRVESPKTAT